MSLDEHFYPFQAHSRAFLERAESHLGLFDTNGDPESLLHAAMHLRFGIEARVTDYLRVALEARGKRVEQVSEYVASKLLRILAAEDPTASRASVFRLTNEQTGGGSAMRYTPVTPELAAIHGKLGGFLHYRFFVSNQMWNFRKSPGAGKGLSLADLRELLRQGIDGLRYATSGTLLGNVHFERLVERALDDGEDEQADPRAMSGGSGQKE